MRRNSSGDKVRERRTEEGMKIGGGGGGGEVKRGEKNSTDRRVTDLFPLPVLTFLNNSTHSSKAGCDHI